MAGRSPRHRGRNGVTPTMTYNEYPDDDTEPFSDRDDLRGGPDPDRPVDQVWK